VRGPLYGAADIAVDTSGLSLGESFEALLRAARATAGQESARGNS